MEGATKSNKGSGCCVISAACNAGIPVSRTASRKPVMDGALDISKFWLIGAENLAIRMPVCMNKAMQWLDATVPRFRSSMESNTE